MLIESRNGSPGAPDHVPVAPLLPDLPPALAEAKRLAQEALAEAKKAAAEALRRMATANRLALLHAIEQSVEPLLFPIARIGPDEVGPHQSTFELRIRFAGHYAIVAAFERVDCQRDGAPEWRRKDFATHHADGATWKVCSPAIAYTPDLAVALALAEMPPEAVRREEAARAEQEFQDVPF